jgi:hypothetical protein
VELLRLFDGRFPFLGVEGLQAHLVATSAATAPAIVMKRDWLALFLILGAFTASLFEFRLACPFLLFWMLETDWKRMDRNGWTLVMLMFGFQVFRIWLSGRW